MLRELIWTGFYGNRTSRANEEKEDQHYHSGVVVAKMLELALRSFMQFVTNQNAQIYLYELIGSLTQSMTEKETVTKAKLIVNDYARREAINALDKVNREKKEKGCGIFTMRQTSSRWCKQLA